MQLLSTRVQEVVSMTKHLVTERLSASGVSPIKSNIFSALDLLLNWSPHYQPKALILVKKFRTKIGVLLMNLFYSWKHVPPVKQLVTSKTHLKAGPRGLPLPLWRWRQSGCGGVCAACCPCQWSRRLQADAGSPESPQSCSCWGRFLLTSCSASVCPQKLWVTPLLCRETSHSVRHGHVPQVSFCQK